MFGLSAQPEGGVWYPRELVSLISRFDLIKHAINIGRRFQLFVIT